MNMANHRAVDNGQLTSVGRRECEHCHGTGWAADCDAATHLEKLRSFVRERGFWISADERVREAVAAQLLGLKPKTLENWRGAGARLPHIKRGGRPLYALVDLAGHLAATER